MSLFAPHAVPGEDLPVSVGVASSALGVLAAGLWLVLSQQPHVAPASGSTESRLNAASTLRSPPPAATPAALVPAPAPPPPAARPCPALVLQFPAGMSHLATADERRIARLAVRLAAQPDARVLVRGHADGAGTDALNLLLSRKRAEAVQRSLIATGVSRRAIQVQAFGEYAPLEGLSPSEPENRRATIEVRAAHGCVTEEELP